MSDYVAKTDIAARTLLAPDAINIYNIGEVLTLFLHSKIEPLLVLDLLNTVEIDTTGMQLLLAFQHHCVEQQCQLKLCNVSESVEQTMQLFQCTFERLATESNEMDYSV